MIYILKYISSFSLFSFPKRIFISIFLENNIISVKLAYLRVVYLPPKKNSFLGFAAPFLGPQGEVIAPQKKIEKNKNKNKTWGQV